MKTNNGTDKTYMAYVNADSSDIHFKLLDPNTQQWEPAFKTVERVTTTNYEYDDFFLNAVEEDDLPYVVFLDQDSLIVKQFENGDWQKTDTAIFYNTNDDLLDLYHGDDYFFTFKRLRDVADRPCSL